MMSSITEPTDGAKPSLIVWSWPYLFAIAILGLTGYSFYRLIEAPAFASSRSLHGYSAIAYSRSTGEFGSSSDCDTLAEAERLAISHCKQKDARVVAWSHDAWCALAIGGDKAFGIGWAKNQKQAEENALAHCREHTKTPCHLAVAVSSSGTESDASVSEMSGTYAAIAYSRSTGLFGSSRHCATLADAERIAIAGCNAPDAQVVAWTQKGFCALAIAEDRAYGYAWGNSAAEVEASALEQCRRYAAGPCHVAVVVDANP